MKLPKFTKGLWKILLALVIFIMLNTSAQYFYSRYHWISPIIFRSPIEKNILVSPLPKKATESARLVPQAYAEEPQLPPRARTLKAAVEKFGWDQFESFELLIDHESGFRPDSVNSSSGACGIFQALPCSKYPSMDVGDQITWGLSYIKNRYETPSEAWKFWQQHSWY